MTRPAATPERTIVYQKILGRLIAKEEFAIDEIQESQGGDYPLVTQKIVQDLVAQGSLAAVSGDEEGRYRWLHRPEELNVEAWVLSRVVGTLITAAPVDERPRERLVKYGASHLKLAELLAILIRSGRPGESVRRGQVAGQG